FILLLGAEVNSWAVGQRETAADIPSIMHEVQAHDTTRGAAGPTAGTSQEDLQSGKGKAAMRGDEAAVEHERGAHGDDVKPPKFAEANAPDPNKTAAEAERSSGYDTNRPQHRPEPGIRQDTGQDGGQDTGRDVDGASPGGNMSRAGDRGLSSPVDDD